MKKTRFNRITAIIAEEGIKNATLAEYVGVTVETISKWRTNRAQPPIRKLYKVAEFFKIDVRELLVPRVWEEGPSAAEIAKAINVKNRFKKQKRINK
jgi:transcriptional regulator with XRE-family HTH domain